MVKFGKMVGDIKSGRLSKSENGRGSLEVVGGSSGVVGGLRKWSKNGKGVKFL